ncbi:C40 family peptidase [Algivirga pacifica]
MLLHYKPIRFSILISILFLAFVQQSCKTRYTYADRTKKLETNEREAIKAYQDKYASKLDKIVADNSAPEKTGPIKVNSEAVAIAIKESVNWMGVKYRIGGMTKKGVDCSGLTYQLYKKAGIELPRNSSSQSRYGSPVKRSDLQPGDLIFFTTPGNGRNIRHVGMVMEVTSNDVIFVHASTSKGVRKDNLNGWWSDYYIKAQRPVNTP